MSGYSFLHQFLKQIEAIQFAVDWNNKGRQYGGKKFKTNFSRTVYEAHTGCPPPNLAGSHPDERKAFNAFKQSHQCSITIQNHLLDMYKFVSDSHKIFTVID